MSMHINGGGGIRPLGTPPQQTPVERSSQQTDTPSIGQQKSAPSGPVLNSINQFTSQPVSTDLQQLQQWLNNLRKADQPQKPETQPPATPPATPTPTEPQAQKPQSQPATPPATPTPTEPQTQKPQSQPATPPATPTPTEPQTQKPQPQPATPPATPTPTEPQTQKPQSQPATPPATPTPTEPQTQKPQPQSATPASNPAQHSLTPTQAQTAIGPIQTSPTQENKEPVPSKPAEPVPPPQLSDQQKQRLKTGIGQLAQTLEFSKADLSRLAFAKASGNQGQFFFQLGKMNQSPGSRTVNKLEAGLERLFTAVGGSKEAIADGVLPGIVLDDLSRLAKTTELVPSQLLDLGALTHNEADRFNQLAAAMGVSEDQSSKVLDGLQALSHRFDLSAAELDTMLGETSSAINRMLGREFDKGAQKLNLEPQVFNGLANAILTKNREKFDQIALNAGITREQLDSTVNAVARELNNIRKNPAISNEKMTRFSKDVLVQGMIEAAGQPFGLSPEQSMRMATAFVDGGLFGFVALAEEYGVQGANTLLNKLEAIESQQGTGALGLSTNNIEEIAQQRRLMKTLGLQNKPIAWATTDPQTHPATEKGSFDFFQPVTELMNTLQATANRAAKEVQAYNTQQASDRVRHATLSTQLASVNAKIEDLERRRNAFPGIFLRIQIDGHLHQFRNQKAEIDKAIEQINTRGSQPSPAEAAAVEIQGQLTALKQRYNNILEKTRKDPLVVMVSQTTVTTLKNQISALEQQLNTLK